MALLFVDDDDDDDRGRFMVFSRVVAFVIVMVDGGERAIK